MNEKKARQIFKLIAAYMAGYATMGLIAYPVMAKMEKINDKLFTAAKDNHDLAVKLARHINDDLLETLLDEFQFEMITRDFE
jgi:hypothetical protein